METKNLTIRDIANEAGVSTATVSRYLNGKYESMQESTRERISNVIQKTGYVPNHMATALRTNRTDLIGLIMSNIKGSRTPTLIAGVCNTCAKYGKKVIIVDSNDDPEAEKKLAHDLLEHRVAGLLVLSGNNYDFYCDIHKNRIPVLISDRIPAVSAIPAVAINHSSATSAVINKLLDDGFKRIVLIQQTHNNPNNTHKLRAKVATDTYIKRMGSDGELYCHTIDIKDSSTSDMLDSLSRIVLDYYSKSSDIPTAFFSVENDTMIALVNVYYQQGLKLSDSFTIAGYGGWEMRGLLPEACMIDQPLEKLGEISAELLFEIIQKRADGAEPEDIPRKLLDANIIMP